MTIADIEDTVYRWHCGLLRDLIAGRILPIQLIAGMETANAWGIERHAELFGPNERTDLCPTASF